MMRNPIVKIIEKGVRLMNRAALLAVANFPASATVRMTRDEKLLLDDLCKYIEPSNLATRNGKVVYRLAPLEEITLWAMLETRRAEGSLERIKAWTGDNYEAHSIAEVVKLDKFIREALKDADGLERMLFANVPNTESALTGAAEVKEAKNLLGIVQTAADLFKCSFEQAKQLNYTDAIIAMSKKHDEVEKEKKELKKQQRR